MAPIWAIGYLSGFGSVEGLCFYAKLLRIDDEIQLCDLERIIAAAD